MRFEQDAEAERLLNVGLAPFRYVNALAGVRRRESVLNQPSQGCPHRRAAKTQLSRQRFFPKDGEDGMTELKNVSGLPALIFKDVATAVISDNLERMPGATG
ncbi:hypothetical protein chiPu_0031551, partial [Chiloscyllium punctatum]|nr:hypothetical protein [Chiloscyllium punctatum]